MHAHRRCVFAAQDKAARQDDTDDLLAGGISAAVPYGATGLQDENQQLSAMAESPMIHSRIMSGMPLASPTNTTPLSMDLTNNNSLMSLNGGSASKGSASKRSKASASAAPRPSPRKSPRRANNKQHEEAPDLSPAAAALPPPPPVSQEFTRNITCSVPALSTLVEEDEDGMLLAAGETGSLAPTPASGANGANAAAVPYDDFGILSPEELQQPVVQNECIDKGDGRGSFVLNLKGELPCHVVLAHSF